MHVLDREARPTREAGAQLCVDRRGVWLRMSEGAGIAHVNGRQVRRMAMLRTGDAIWLDGVEMLLLPGEPASVRSDASADGEESDSRIVLRGVGGQHHGRCFSLDQPRTVGSGIDCDIRLDEPAFAGRHARLQLQGRTVKLQALAPGDTTQVNGEPVHDAVLHPGDQVVFDAHHRFVVEAPGHPRRHPAPPGEGEADVEVLPAARPDAVVEQSPRRWRLPWLLLAALLIAGSLGALLLFGAV